MSNTNSSEDNIESPSTYASKAYKEYRKKEKSKNTSSRNRHNAVDGRELEEGQTFQY
ncbi:MAG: hypothetical protein WA460_02990 [Nitrososphaeraceae archaeon]